MKSKSITHMNKSKGIISEEDFSRLYSYNLKFKDCSACKTCKQCGIAHNKHYIYLYPGELEFRELWELHPVFHYENSIIVDGDRLYACPHDFSSGMPCVDSTLSCRLCPINIYERKGEKAFSEVSCKMKTIDMKWFKEALKVIVDLYLVIGVGKK
jgi:hypothetical protein